MSSQKSLMSNCSLGSESSFHKRNALSNKEPSFRLPGLSGHSKDPSCRSLNSQLSFRLKGLAKEDSFRLPNRSSSRGTNSNNGRISHNSRSLLYGSSTHGSSFGVSTNIGNTHDFGASIRLCDESMGDMDLSMSGTSGSTRSTRRGARWGEESIKFSAKNFVAQNEDSLETHYKIGELLGEGGFGEVFSCIHIESGEERAVKVIPKQEDEAENVKIIEEFDIVKDLDHPNILKMYALYESIDSFFLVTDIYNGGELYDELAQFGRFSEEEAALLMNNILSCINYCHKKGLVHRDLKPENVLLEENKDFDDLKVIDFGLAEYGEAFSDIEGSSYYVSPQVIQGHYGLKADVWSCGVIAFVCLGGYAPFEGADDDEVLQAVLDFDGQLDFDDPVWDGISDEAADFVAQLLTYDQNERPSAEEALQHPWLKNCRSRSSSCSKRRESTRTSLGCLQSFQADSKLKQCACSLIASQLLRKEEKEEIDMVFRSLDFDCDGKLTKADVKQSFKEFFGEDISEEDLDVMFHQVNFSGSGAIEYSEFVASTLMEKNLVDDTKLKAAFKMFDRDGKGYISNEDLKAVLCLDDGMDEYIVHKIIRQVDQNKDGKIQFEEFQDMMFSNGIAPSYTPPRRQRMLREGKAWGSNRTDTTVTGSDRFVEYSDEDCSEVDDFFADLNGSQTSISFKSVLDKFEETKCNQ